MRSFKSNSLNEAGFPWDGPHRFISRFLFAGSHVSGPAFLFQAPVNRIPVLYLSAATAAILKRR